jgi:hypothetical protein
MKAWQQGDVIGRKVRALPDGAKPVAREHGACVLAHGEHTGHKHQVMEADAELFTMDLDMYLRCMSVSTLVHEEHGPITLDPGIYKIERVREHDYLSGMVGPVQD